MQRTATPCHRLALLFLCATLLGTGPLAGSVRAQGSPSARALALGGSIVALAQGLEAVTWNPAALRVARSSLQLDLVGISTEVRNNSFTVGDYNRFTGTFLDDDDKTYILERVPTGGLNLNGEATAQAVSLWASPVAVTFSSQAAAFGNLSRDAVELLLFGNAHFDSVHLTGTGGETFVTAGIGFSYAHMISEIAGGRLNAGSTIRYIKGLFVEEITESDGSIITSDQGISGDARLTARTANDGTGLAMDAGLLYDYGHGWQFGAAVTNLLGHVTWRGHPEAYAFTFGVDSLSVLNADTDDLIESHDSTYPIEAFSTRLPATLRVGASHTSGRMAWMAQWENRLNRAAGEHTSPRLAGGIEWWPTSMLPLRAGVSVGGGRSVKASAGSGIHTGPFYLDFGFGLGNGVTWGGAKGLELALNTGIRL